MKQSKWNMRKSSVIRMGAALVLLAIASMGTPGTAQAANGQCRWEGGPGASGETNKYCLMEDCAGMGGFARCTVAEGAAPSSTLDPELGPDKWTFDACDHEAPSAGLMASWCIRAGGTWEGANYGGCQNLPPGVFSGGTSSNSEGTTMAIADGFIDGRFGADCAGQVVSDTGWGATLSSQWCWTGSDSTTLGILTHSLRRRVYQPVGPGCTTSGTRMISFMKSRSAQCPAGYKTRSGALPGAQCYIPAGECCKTGDGTSPFSGGTTFTDSDYGGGGGRIGGGLSSGAGSLSFSRTYNSMGFYRPMLLPTAALADTDMKPGDFWSHNYDRRLYITTGNSEVIGFNRRHDGTIITFDSQGREQANVDGGAARLIEIPGVGWDLKLKNLDVERYDLGGKLQSITTGGGQVTTLTYTADQLTSVTDHFGHALQLAYNGDGLLSTVTLPGGEVVTYGYDGWKRLASVARPGQPVRTYQYGELKHGWLLTGILDDGQVVQSYDYDNSGRVIDSQMANGADRRQFVYNTASTTVTDANGAVAVFGIANAGGMAKANSRSVPCADCGPTAFTTYDANGNPSAKTDFNGVQTLYLYDLTRNLETWRTEAAGTPVERVITTTWHPTLRSPEEINEPGRRTNFTYDAQGNLLTRTVTDTATNVSRTWAYTYNSFGQVLTEDGPRTDVNDVTTYTYHSCGTGNECGRLATVTNAAGHTTSYLTYNAHGNALTISDANGLITTLSYDAANRLQSRTIGTETTTFVYWPNGLQKRVTNPDGSFIEYTYDAARRLTGIEDQEGNRIAYTLDAAGNRTREDVYDPTDVLVRTRSAAFDTSGRKIRDIDSNASASTFEYDPAGNQVSTTDPLSRVTLSSYDELHRLSSTVDPVGQITGFSYDARGNLSAVTDPRQLITSYQYNAFGDVTQLSSPDTGISTKEFDDDGQLLEQTDSRGDTAEFTFDALGRVLATEYSDQTLTYTYDAGPNALGKLSQVSNAASSISWAYDAYGRVSSKTQTIGAVPLTTTYTYDGFGRVATLTTPSGQVVEYQYLNGHISGIKVNGSQLLSNILFTPFGPTRGWQWGNGTYTVREYDQDGRISMIDSAGLASYSYGPDGSIQTVSDESVAPSSAGQPSVELAVSASSNRLETLKDGGTRSYSYDAGGNTLSDGIRTFTYDDSGRMTSATRDGLTTQYTYNALGQRVRKANSGLVQYFVYDEEGHLLGVYGVNGALIEEFVWLGDIPVATVRNTETGGIGFFYIHTDHLNTPVRVTRHDDNAVMWRWDRDPYGNGAPNEDAEGNGQFVFLNLRFPGQQFDAETGLHYNYFRDYDPAVGKYVESDPIGLYGGWNTYAYSALDPIRGFDPFGLEPPEPPGPSPSIRLDSAIKRGDTKAIEDMMEALGPGEQTLAKNALQRLNSKAGDIIAKECRGSINREFPSELRDKTLKEIMDAAKGGDSPARKAMKLLNDSRFKK
jgi:RHS repeat-associated protein